MIKLFTTIGSLFTITTMFAQPLLQSNDLQTGSNFNLYFLSNVNTANLTPTGAGVTWDISAATGALAGTAEFQDMAATPFAAQYPAANFAMKFTLSGGTPQYSLFNKTATVFEEVANNVGTPSETPFTNYRTALVFPFSFGLSNTDTYQKSGQGTKTVVNNYDSYGTLISNTATYSNVVRILIDDDGNTGANFWRTSPILPLLQVGSNSFILWQPGTLGINDVASNVVFDLYPNPATNELHIINKQLISKIEIFNMLGQLQFITKQSIIDVSKLEKGVYFLTVTILKGESISQKFVKE